MAEQPGTAALQTLGYAQQRAVGIQAGQGGMQGVRQFAGQGMATPTQEESTGALLMQLGGQFLEGKLKAAQNKQFLEGAQRVAMGEALKDVVDEQPWYSKIFGPSASAQGARTVAQMKGVDDFITGVQEDMPSLQKLNSKEFGQQITERMSQFLTGDDVADAAIQVKMVESIGALTKAHTKAHYKWGQNNMQQTMVSYMIGGAKKLQAMAQQQLEGTMTEADFNDVKAGFIGNLMPMAGQSPESYWAGIQAATIDALSQGNHHAANAIFDSGLLDSAPAAVRKELVDARHTYEGRTQETAGFAEYGPIIGQLTGLARAGQLTGNQIVAKVDEINRDYAIRYGVDRPLFKRDQLVSLISGNISSIYSDAKADARQARSDARADKREGMKEQIKAETEARKAQQLVSLLQAGVGDMATLAGYSKDEIDRGVYTGALIVGQQGGSVGEYLARQYNQGGAHVNSLYQNKLQAGMRAAKNEGHTGQSFNESYELYKQLDAQQGGKAAAMAYLGDDALRMMKYDTMVTKGGLAPETAYQVAFGNPIDRTRKSTDKEIREAIDKAVKDDQPGIFSRLFTPAVELTAQSQRALSGAVAENYDLLVQNANLDDTQAMKVALGIAKRDLDVVGKYVYEKGADRQPLYQLIGSDEATAGKVFDTFLQERSKALGVKASDSNVTIMRLPDQEGIGMFGVMVVDEDGNMKQFPMSSKELRGRYEKGKDFK